MIGVPWLLLMRRPQDCGSSIVALMRVPASPTDICSYYQEQLENRSVQGNWFIRLAAGQSTQEDDPLLLSTRVRSLNSALTADELHQTYLTLAKELGLGEPSVDPQPRRAYNLLISRHWMAMVRRKIEGIRGFSVNALGFAGSLLSTEASDLNWIHKAGPEALLRAVVETDNGD